MSGEGLDDMGNDAEAIQWYRKELWRTPHRVPVQLRLCRLLLKSPDAPVEAIAESLQRTRAAMERTPNDEAWLGTLAVAQCRSGDYGADTTTRDILGQGFEANFNLVKDRLGRLIHLHDMSHPFSRAKQTDNCLSANQLQQAYPLSVMFTLSASGHGIHRAAIHSLGDAVRILCQRRSRRGRHSSPRPSLEYHLRMIASPAKCTDERQR